jgi:hypothetical protein
VADHFRVNHSISVRLVQRFPDQWTRLHVRIVHPKLSCDQSNRAWRWRNVNCGRFIGHRARIPWWWRRLITVCVLMWPPNVKLPRSAPTVLISVRLVQRFRQTGNVTDRRRASRPRQATPREDRIISRRAWQRLFSTVGALRGNLTFGGHISTHTVIRRLHHQGMRARWPIKRPQLTLCGLALSSMNISL